MLFLSFKNKFEENVDNPDISDSLPLSFCVFIIYKRHNGDVLAT